MKKYAVYLAIEFLLKSILRSMDFTETTRRSGRSWKFWPKLYENLKYEISVSMQFIDLSKYDGRVLPALRDHFKKIVIPQIRQYDQWGPLKENKQGQHQIEAFRRTLSDFESYLHSAQTNIDGAVKERIKILALS